jgi:hypothetical protein
MKMYPANNEKGNVLLCVMGVILVLSIVGATVLRNSTTRLNVSSNQVRAWKEALSAAEAGGNMAFAELRKEFSADSSVRASQWSGWTNSGTTYVSPESTFGSSNLKSRTVVETCYFDVSGNFHLGENPDPNANSWYRVRSRGVSVLPGLKRTGMDDALRNEGRTHFATFGSTAMKDITARGNGDSLLRKIDFNYDHFVATYGRSWDDPLSTRNDPVAVGDTPQISRRIEQIVAPLTPFFDAAIKSSGTFYGLGSAAQIDSYDSRQGPYAFVANSPSDSRYPNSRHGNVEIGSSTATVKGMIYGDVATNGGTIVNSSQITGTVDNNVPFTLSDYKMPDTTSWQYEPAPPSGGGLAYQLGTSYSGNKTLTPRYAGTVDAPVYYVVSSFNGALTVNPTAAGTDTYVAIHVTGDISGGSAGITVNPYVHVKIYFDHDMDVKNNNLINQNPTSTNPRAANLQFYGISPPRDANGNPMWTQTINLNSATPSTLAMTFYAPSADIILNGNPDFIGSMVCKTFYANGNISWHYDRALNSEGQLLDFKIASYIEDTR